MSNIEDDIKDNNKKEEDNIKDNNKTNKTNNNVKTKKPKKIYKTNKTNNNVKTKKTKKIYKTIGNNLNDNNVEKKVKNYKKSPKNPNEDKKDINNNELGKMIHPISPQGGANQLTAGKISARKKQNADNVKKNPEKSTKIIKP